MAHVVPLMPWDCPSREIVQLVRRLLTATRLRDELVRHPSRFRGRIFAGQAPPRVPNERASRLHANVRPAWFLLLTGIRQSYHPQQSAARGSNRKRTATLFEALPN